MVLALFEGSKPLTVVKQYIYAIFYQNIFIKIFTLVKYREKELQSRWDVDDREVLSNFWTFVCFPV